MMEKKVVGGKVVIALAIMCIVLVGGLGASIASYTTIINSKDKTHQDYVSTHSHTNDEYNSLNAAYNGYMGTHTHSDSQYNDYVANHNIANTEYNSLNASYNDYMGTHTHSDSQYNAYVADHHYTDEEFNSALTAPRLVTVNMTGDDNGPVAMDPLSPLFGTSAFHVYGYVLNVGPNAAYNAEIHVVAYQLGGGKAIDTYITLNTMRGYSWTQVDSNFFYTGDSLISWTITPQWTTK
jgi:uncharacterized protein YpmS